MGGMEIVKGERWKVYAEGYCGWYKVEGVNVKVCRVEGGRWWGSMSMLPKSGKNAARIWKRLEISNWKILPVRLL